MCDHDGLAVAPEGFLEDSGQLRVSVVDVIGVIGSQGVDAVCQRQQGAVDVSSFNHSLPAILG